MSLDRLHKISSILFSGIGSLVLGYFTLTGNWKEFTLKEEQFCVNTESYYVQAALRSEIAPPLALLNRIKERCGFASIDEARFAFQSEKAGYAQILSADIAPLEQPIIEGGSSLESGEIELDTNDGWVVLASFNADGSDSNFTRADTGEAAVMDMTAPPEGTILTAKWPVNLRQNTQKTGGDLNPSLDILDTGSCVKVTGDPVTQRSVIWAPVAYATCAP